MQRVLAQDIRRWQTALRSRPDATTASLCVCSWREADTCCAARVLTAAQHVCVVWGGTHRPEFAEIIPDHHDSKTASCSAGLLAQARTFVHDLAGDTDKKAAKCTKIMERVMADVHPFTVYDIYADACPADGLNSRSGAGGVTGQLSRALSGVGGGERPAHCPVNAPSHGEYHRHRLGSQPAGRKHTLHKVLGGYGGLAGHLLGARCIKLQGCT